LGYNLTKNHKPFIGLGRYATYKDHSINKEEFRVWLQDVIDVKKGIVSSKTDSVQKNHGFTNLSLTKIPKECVTVTV
jgi:hypothetical protein